MAVTVNNLAVSPVELNCFLGLYCLTLVTAQTRYSYPWMLLFSLYISEGVTDLFAEILLSDRKQLPFLILNLDDWKWTRSSWEKSVVF
jgi:hypothetical protein